MLTIASFPLLFQDDSIVIREYDKGVSRSLDVYEIINSIATKISTIRSTEQIRRRVRDLVGSKNIGMVIWYSVSESLEISLRDSKGESQGPDSSEWYNFYLYI